ncbi:MAG: Imm52 family immunity protein [Planctomycetota bacterium]|nr:Imm52 family immunity protein [Planctomycetota bacterium]
MKYMFPETVRGFWPARIETREQVVERSARCARRIAEILPLQTPFGMWRGEEQSPSFSVVDFGTPQGRAEFLATCLKESDRGPAGEYFHVGLYSQTTDLPNRSVSISGWAGCTKALPGHNYNNMGVDWGGDGDRPLPCEVVARLIEAVADTWHPDFCECFSLDWEPIRKMHRLTWNAAVPRIGWMVYLAERELKASDVPSAHLVRPCGPRGSLVIVREEPIRMMHKQDFALAERVRNELGLPLPYFID